MQALIQLQIDYYFAIKRALLRQVQETDTLIEKLQTLMIEHSKKDDEMDVIEVQDEKK